MIIKKDVIILAAGVGKRLFPYTVNTPKCLVEINRKSILENTLDALLEHREQISTVYIVIGFLKESVVKRIHDKPQYQLLNIRYIENTIYRETNNIYSLWLAGTHVTKDVILIESDVFFCKPTLDILFETRQNLALVDDYAPYMEGTAIEMDSRDRIINIITQKTPIPPLGLHKTLNIYHFTKAFFHDAFLPVLDSYIQKHDYNSYYEVILQLIVLTGNHEIFGKVMRGSQWCEIDDMEDLRRARYMFSPAEEQINTLTQSFGGYWNYSFHDFNLLHNDCFPPLEMVEGMKSVLNKLLSHYPSNDAVLFDKARKLLPENACINHVVLGNGSCQIIHALIELIREETIVIVVPTFGEYLKHKSANLFSTEDTGFKLDVPALIDFVNQNEIKYIVLANPNNPTSLLVEKSELCMLLGKCPRQTFIVDESFMKFSVNEASLLAEYQNHPSLVIVKSLGKEYGVPGLRLGYALSANVQLIGSLKKQIPVWNINSIAEFFLETVGRYQFEFEQ